MEFTIKFTWYIRYQSISHVHDMIWYDIWYMIWYYMIRYMIWYVRICKDMIWYDMIYVIRYDTVRYDTIWYDIRYDTHTWYDVYTHTYKEWNGPGLASCPRLGEGRNHIRSLLFSVYSRNYRSDLDTYLMWFGWMIILACVDSIWPI